MKEQKKAENKSDPGEYIGSVQQFEFGLLSSNRFLKGFPQNSMTLLVQSDLGCK